jgi:hypothetical protein
MSAPDGHAHVFSALARFCWTCGVAMRDVEDSLLTSTRTGDVVRKTKAVP